MQDWLQQQELSAPTKWISGSTWWWSSATTTRKGLARFSEAIFVIARWLLRKSSDNAQSFAWNMSDTVQAVLTPPPTGISTLSGSVCCNSRVTEISSINIARKRQQTTTFQCFLAGSTAGAGRPLRRCAAPWLARRARLSFVTRTVVPWLASVCVHVNSCSTR